MSANRTTSISQAAGDEEIGAYWDDHDLSERWLETRDVRMEVDLQSSAVYFAVDKSLAAKLRSVADQRGLSAERLLNEWVAERVATEPPK